jgi:hypothetical protein
VNQTVGLGAERHALYAVATGGNHAGNIGKNITADADDAFLGLKLHSNLPFRELQEHNFICFYILFQNRKKYKRKNFIPAHMRDCFFENVRVNYTCLYYRKGAAI